MTMPLCKEGHYYSPGGECAQCAAPPAEPLPDGAVMVEVGALSYPAIILGPADSISVSSPDWTGTGTETVVVRRSRVRFLRGPRAGREEIVPDSSIW